MKIVVAGFIVRYPLGGNAWHQLQYVLGLERLGHDVAFVEHAAWDESCFDPVDDVMTSDPTRGLAFLRDVWERHGVRASWCYVDERGGEHNMTRQELEVKCGEADLLINIGNVNWLPEFELCRRRALVDIDPVFTQIGAVGMIDPHEHHDILFTFGENMAGAGAAVPFDAAHWLPTRQPIVLDCWPARPGDPSAAMTSVINWTAYGDHVFEGQTFGQKDRQFEPFFDLPRTVDRPMELALGAPLDVQDRLRCGGWAVVDPMAVSRNTATFQGYLAASSAEFCVAKHGYVISRSGWFSDRSACYLAAGRPVILEDTGFSAVLPCGDGLLPFSSPGDARAAIKAVDSNYDHHCRAAREVAEEYFDSDVILTALLERAT
ncbi:MAG: hypothetical protein JO248_18640 [Acidimicrobiia bacterium]|nr:hypothetical protein [Acidimicrobiia bacterium]